MRADVPEQPVPGLGREVRGRVDRPAKGTALVPDEPGRAFLREELSEQARGSREASHHADRAEEAALSGEVGDALGRCAVERERLLTEDVLSVLEQRLYLLGVHDRRRRDDRELLCTSHHRVPGRRDGARRHQGGDLCRLRQPRVEEPHRPDPAVGLQAHERRSVVAARDRAAPDEDDAHGRRPRRRGMERPHRVHCDPILRRRATERESTRAMPAAVRGDLSSLQTTRSWARAAAASPCDWSLRAVSSPDAA